MILVSQCCEALNMVVFAAVLYDISMELASGSFEWGIWCYCIGQHPVQTSADTCRQCNFIQCNVYQGAQGAMKSISVNAMSF